MKAYRHFQPCRQDAICFRHYKHGHRTTKGPALAGLAYRKLAGLIPAGSFVRFKPNNNNPAGRYHFLPQHLLSEFESALRLRALLMSLTHTSRIVSGRELATFDLPRPSYPLCSRLQSRLDRRPSRRLVKFRRLVPKGYATPFPLCFTYHLRPCTSFFLEKKGPSRSCQTENATVSSSRTHKSSSLGLNLKEHD